MKGTRCDEHRKLAEPAPFEVHRFAGVEVTDKHPRGHYDRKRPADHSRHVCSGSNRQCVADGSCGKNLARLHCPFDERVRAILTRRDVHVVHPMLEVEVVVEQIDSRVHDH